MTTPVQHAIRKAVSTDLADIQNIAQDAYSMYLPRMDKKPFPMLEDYGELISKGLVYVLHHEHGGIIGFIVLVALPQQSEMLLDNVAVRTDCKGKGFGRILLNFAEELAKKNKLVRLVLYTNQAMTENQTLYPHLGFVESHRACEKGYQRIYYYKNLHA